MAITVQQAVDAANTFWKHSIDLQEIESSRLGAFIDGSFTDEDIKNVIAEVENLGCADFTTALGEFILDGRAAQVKSGIYQP